MLNNGPKSGPVQVGYAQKGMGMRIACTGLAEFMLEQVGNSAYSRQAPEIGNR